VIYCNFKSQLYNSKCCADGQPCSDAPVEHHCQCLDRVVMTINTSKPSKQCCSNQKEKKTHGLSSYLTKLPASEAFTSPDIYPRDDIAARCLYEKGGERVCVWSVYGLCMVGSYSREVCVANGVRQKPPCRPAIVGESCPCGVSWLDAP
jgi:hypothetical protein